jgi:serine protease
MVRILFFIAALSASSVNAFTQNTQPLFFLPPGCTPDDYVPNTILFNLSETAEPGWTYTKSGNGKLDKALNSIGAEHVAKRFPHHAAPSEKFDKAGRRLSDLSRIFECTYTSGLPVEKAIHLLLASGSLEYAQPRYINRPFAYIPDDPLNFNQYHLPLCKFFEAWDIEKGDTNIVIGIVDWGTEMNHPDLRNNIKYNYNDPIDGMDNDNDGFVDNYMGWDLGCNDNNPQQTGGMIHGTYVSGYASASTDNALGVSGAGFRSKFLPVKISDANNIGTMNYEGIVYAADQGCQVINCSWGTAFYPGPYAQQIIDYAVINRDAVIIAACGNANSSVAYYPASYNHVLSVAATTASDSKWTGSSYGYYVDISAPGENVWTTGAGTSYDYSSGTSFSAPIVAGAAALLRSRFPGHTALQIREQIKVTADIIDTLPANLPYAGLLGAGRLNVLRALTDTLSPSIRMINYQFSDTNQDGIFSPNETIFLSGDFINYLAPSGINTSIALSSLSPHLQVINGNFNAGSMPQLGITNNTGTPFVIYIQSSVPYSHEAFLKLTFSDGSYQGIQYLSVILNPDYVNVSTGTIATTITSNGFLGYNNMIPNQGVGFTYLDSRSLMFAGGLITGVSASQVSDCLYGAGGYMDNDFLPVQNVYRIGSPLHADSETSGAFNDDRAGAQKMGIHVKHQTFAWNDPGLERYIIMEFSLRNDGSQALNNFYAGYYVDWDLRNSLENRAAYMPAERAGYVVPQNGGIYSGIKLLSPGNAFYYAFDNNGINGSVNIYDGFTGAEKYLALRSNRLQAGMSGMGNDVSHMLSTGPFSISPGDSVTVAFALLAGDYPDDFADVASIAQSKYDQMLLVPEHAKSTGLSAEAMPNPLGGNHALKISATQDQEVRIRYADMNGKVLFQFIHSLHSGTNEIQIPSASWASGIYTCTISGRLKTLVIKIVKL